MSLLGGLLDLLLNAMQDFKESDTYKEAKMITDAKKASNSMDQTLKEMYDMDKDLLDK